ncbi:hypothetical protein WJX72_012049 [[Myrmecia] bisecta]|uniref:Uncharacterized protein n=1 Tax=[Myrmecia] bisecta TaxID=41462 RepID=A0AAW1Q901_9CHLO
MWCYGGGTIARAPHRGDQGIKLPGQPGPRKKHAAVVHQGAMYVWGGATQHMDEQYDIGFEHCQAAWRAEKRLLWKLDLSAASAASEGRRGAEPCLQWKQIKCRGNACPMWRREHVAVVHERYMYIHGGFSELLQTGDIWRLNLTNWEQVFEHTCTPAHHLPPAQHARSSHAHAARGMGG